MTGAWGPHRAARSGPVSTRPEGRLGRDGRQEADLDLLLRHRAQGERLRPGFAGAEVQAREFRELGHDGRRDRALLGPVRSRDPDRDGQPGPPPQRSWAVMPQEGVVDAVLQGRERRLPAARVFRCRRPWRAHQIRGGSRVGAQEAPALPPARRGWVPAGAIWVPAGAARVPAGTGAASHGSLRRRRTDLRTHPRSRPRGGPGRFPPRWRRSGRRTPWACRGRDRSR
jgi:hypothetical protein